MKQWNILTFGKHKGQSLPQVLFRDPDWFFWAIANNAFRGRPGKEAEELMTKAKRMNGTGLLADGAETRLLITRVTAVANNVGISTANSAVIVSYEDNHINNNNSVNGAPTVTQTPQ